MGDTRLNSDGPPKGRSVFSLPNASQKPRTGRQKSNIVKIYSRTVKPKFWNMKMSSIVTKKPIVMQPQSRIQKPKPSTVTPKTSSVNPTLSTAKLTKVQPKPGTGLRSVRGEPDDANTKGTIAKLGLINHNKKLVFTAQGPILTRVEQGSTATRLFNALTGKVLKSAIHELITTKPETHTVKTKHITMHPKPEPSTAKIEPSTPKPKSSTNLSDSFTNHEFKKALKF